MSIINRLISGWAPGRDSTNRHGPGNVEDTDTSRSDAYPDSYENYEVSAVFKAHHRATSKANIRVKVWEGKAANANHAKKFAVAIPGVMRKVQRAESKHGRSRFIRLSARKVEE